MVLFNSSNPIAIVTVIIYVIVSSRYVILYFQAISLTIDVYRGRIIFEHNLLKI